MLTKRTLKKVTWLTEDQIDTCSALFKGIMGPLDFPVTKAWYDRTVHQPNYDLMMLHALDEICGTHGIEYITGADLDARGYSTNLCAYLNTGDTYTPTIIYRYDTSIRPWQVASFGDVVEFYEKRKIKIL